MGNRNLENIERDLVTFYKYTISFTESKLFNLKFYDYGELNDICKRKWRIQSVKKIELMSFKKQKKRREA